MKSRASFLSVCVAGALLLTISPWAARGENPAKSHSAAAVVVKDVRVFDGEKILPRATVVMQGGRFAAVGKNIAVPPGAETIPGEGRTLLRPDRRPCSRLG